MGEIAQMALLQATYVFTNVNKLVIWKENLCFFTFLEAVRMITCIHAISFVVYVMIQRCLGSKVATFKLSVILIREQSSIKNEHFGEQ